MKFWGKLVILFLSVLLVVGLVACGNTDGGENERTSVLPTLTKVRVLPMINEHNGDEVNDVCLEKINGVAELFEIEISISNPDNLEIVSFDYNDETYKKDSFSAVSTNKVVVLSNLSVPSDVSDYQITIDNVRYLTKSGSTERIVGLKNNVKNVKIQPTFTLTMSIEKPDSDYHETIKKDNDYQATLELVSASDMNAYATQNPLIPVYGTFGYVFTGWYTEKDGKGTLIDSNDTYSFYSDVTLYAHYERPYTFREEEDEVVITGITKAGINTNFTIEIPSHLGGLPVRSIAPYAFTNVLSDKTIILPDTLVEIGDYAFMGSKGMQIDLKNVEKIGKMAFADCEKIVLGASSEYSRYRIATLPATLKEIGEYAFKGCSWDTSIQNPYRADLYFQPKNTLFIPQTVLKIGKGAFQSSLFESVYFESNISLNSLNFGESAFESSKYLKSVYFSFSFNESGPNYNTTSLSGVKDIPARAFYGCTAIYSSISTPGLKITEGVETVGELAFASSGEGLKFLEYLALPDSLKVIGKQAFANTALKYLYFGENSTLTTLGEYCFENVKCEEITIYSLNNYGKAPFWGSTTIKAINILTDNVPVYGTTDLWGDGLTRKTKYYVKSALLDEFRSSTSWNLDSASEKVLAYDNIVTTSSGVTVCYEPIDENGNYLEGSTDVKITAVLDTTKEITIPSSFSHNSVGLSVISVGRYFVHDEVTKIYLPTSLKRIESRAFYTCDVLYEVLWKDASGVYSRGDNANISLEYVGDNAFNGSAITYFYSNTALTTIGKQAFHNCKNLATVVLNRGTSLKVMGSAFSQSGLKTLVIGINVTSIYDSAFQGNRELGVVLINLSAPPQSTEGNYPQISPFRECSGLNKILLFSNNAMINFRENTIGGVNNTYADVKKADGITSAYEQYAGTWSEALDEYNVA